MNVQNFQQFNEVQQFNSSTVQFVQEFKRFKSSKGSMRSRVQLIQRTINTFNWFKEVQRFGERSIRSRVQWFKCLSPGNNIDSQKPNFYTELCCEVSGDAARLDTPPASALDGLS
jgi:hypothetical protein